jgi:ElaB/YqjD/DUF883 family membrane-anchored ribosome-binding protein
MKSNEERHFETPTALRQDARTLAEDAQALLEATSEIADEKITEARERLAEALQSGKQTYANVRKKVVYGAKVADQTVHEHPYQSMAIALGVGALLGYLLSSRRE